MIFLLAPNQNIYISINNLEMKFLQVLE